MTNIDHARRKVEEAFVAALATADTSEVRALAAVETALWSQLLALGRALVALYLRRQAERLHRVRYLHAGNEYETVGTRSREIGTQFGKLQFDTPVGRQVGKARSARDSPLERALGFCGGFSLGVVVTLTKLTAQMAFRAARGTFRDILKWSPSPRATLRMVDGVAAEAGAFQERAVVPEDDGDILVIAADGKGAPAISSGEYKRRRRPHRRQEKSGTHRHARRLRRRENPRPRRTSGKKSKNAKMAGVGVIYTLRRTPEGVEGPINKQVYATFESYRALFQRLLREAQKRGYGTAKFSRVLFIADGAKVLWDLQREFFPNSEVCLDWYHVVEKLWKAGKALHRNNRVRLEAWVAAQKRRLRHDQIDDVIAELREIFTNTPITGPGNKYRRVVLEKTVAHFAENAARMRYRRLRSMDLDIGSGVVEGAVRHLVAVRLDGPGMRWGRDRMEAVLQLRCILINGQWDEFVRFLEAKDRLLLRPQPIPARTHDAKPKLGKAA